MQPSLFKEMASNEQTHWWFVARRAILNKILLKLPQDGVKEILEVGCGTGGNLDMLSRYGNIYAMERNETARAFASEKHICELAPGSLPNDIPFNHKTFDIIVALDVLEHIEKDADALYALYPRLKLGGWLLVTVPAFNYLWSKHDEIHHHKRRYTIKELQINVSAAGFKTVYVSYFNLLLFPIMAASRIMQRLVGDLFPDGRKIPNKYFNKMLTGLFSIERYLVGTVYLPFGGSIILLGRKT